MKRMFSRVNVIRFFGVGLILWGSHIAWSQSQKGPSTAHSSPAPVRSGKAEKPKQVEINLDKAVEVSMPEITADLKPIAFKTKDGKEGWVLRIPGNRPIATPAYANGMVYIGGGYGSHEFYAFNAQTGTVAWQIKTTDDGPTAAVEEHGYVAFNTESCTVCVVDGKTGNLIWQEWLGDPLMSQPAIYNGKLYIAHPAGQRGAQTLQQQPNGAANGGEIQKDSSSNTPQGEAKLNQNATHEAAPNGVQAQNAAPGGGGYQLLCADLKTGHHLWQQPITADVISAPVIDGNQVYCTCFDGTSFCLNAVNGAPIWKKQNSGTSAPIIADGQVVMTTKSSKNGRAYEGLARVDPKRGETKDKELLAMSTATYLEAGRGGGVALSAPTQHSLDSEVGFGVAPAAAELGKANANVGVNSVVGGWAYQGSHAASARGQVMNAQGASLNALLAKDGRMAWHAEAKGKGIANDSQVFSPPSLGSRNMYLCTAQGHLMSVGQKDGKVAFLYATRQPMAFQPALAQGNVYVGTTNGLLICLKTGQKDADGWTAWGGNAQHNKKN